GSCNDDGKCASPAQGTPWGGGGPAGAARRRVGVPATDPHPASADASATLSRTAGEGQQAEPILELRGVGKRFASGLEALDGIDLNVASGEFLSVLGPSGCGKSTLLRIIAGLSEPTRGTCRLTLSEPEKPIAAGRIGFVFQDP